MCFLSKASKISSDLSPLKSCRHITVYPDSKKKVLMLLTSHLSSIRFVSLAGLCVNQLSLLLQVMAVWFLSTQSSRLAILNIRSLCVPHTSNALTRQMLWFLSQTFPSLSPDPSVVWFHKWIGCFMQSVWICATGAENPVPFCSVQQVTHIATPHAGNLQYASLKSPLGTGLGKKNLQNKKHTDI